MHILAWVFFILFVIFSFPRSSNPPVNWWSRTNPYAAWVFEVLVLLLILVKVLPFPWGS
jgi:hypothetical protein